MLGFVLEIYFYLPLLLKDKTKNSQITKALSRNKNGYSHFIQNKK